MNALTRGEIHFLQMLVAREIMYSEDSLCGTFDEGALEDEVAFLEETKALAKKLSELEHV